MVGAADGKCPALIGTFHKTGTVLIRSILEAAHCEGLITLWRIESELRPSTWNVGFAEHCHFPKDVLASPHRGVVVIRDPRDVIISGAHYHGRAGEAWLNEPEERFAGQSYREAISSLPSLDDRLQFEMMHAGGDTIRHMLEFVSSTRDFLVVKYEDLVSNVDLTGFTAMFQHLFISDAHKPRMLQIASTNSLFSGATSSHVRDGSAGQWRKMLGTPFLRTFADRYDALTLQLGYPSTAES